MVTIPAFNDAVHRRTPALLVQQAVTQFLFFLSASLFCGLLAAVIPVSDSEQRHRSEEKSAEYVYEVIDSNARITTSLNGGSDSGSPALPVFVPDFSAGALRLGRSAGLTDHSLTLTVDPRAFWGSDSSPPIQSTIL